jgi:hypothetical protein
MPRLEWIEFRLNNWARWRLTRGGGVLGYAAVNMADPTPGVREPYAAVAIPTNDVEASETQDAIQKLTTPELKRAVEEFYLGKGGIRDKARRLCCGESTVYARVEQAHHQLATLLTEKQTKARDERARVELQQHLARPRGSFTA